MATTPDTINTHFFVIHFPIMILFYFFIILLPPISNHPVTRRQLHDLESYKHLGLDRQILLEEDDRGLVLRLVICSFNEIGIIDCNGL